MGGLLFDYFVTHDAVEIRLFRALLVYRLRKHNIVAAHVIDGVFNFGALSGLGSHPWNTISMGNRWRRRWVLLEKRHWPRFLAISPNDADEFADAVTIACKSQPWVIDTIADRFSPLPPMPQACYGDHHGTDGACVDDWAGQIAVRGQAREDRQGEAEVETMIDKNAARIWRGKIRDVLNQVWDPIGGCPEDEYNTYMGKIAAMIRDDATDDELLSYLEWAEVEHMGGGLPFDRERGLKVVAALRILGSPPQLMLSLSKTTSPKWETA